MTREALNKLNKEAKDHLTTLSTLISRDKERGVQILVDLEKGELRGYLKCMKDLGMITGYEMMVLYTWFASEDRGKTK